jgi:hypothetical protein
VSEHQEIRRRLASIGKNRQWLAKQLNMSEHTIRQYLQPKGKRTKEFLDEIERVITLEAARQREVQPDAPPWNVIFRTAEEFDKADRASRLVKAESLVEFCRAVILERADDLLAMKSRSSYRNLQELPSAKVADAADGQT